MVGKQRAAAEFKIGHDSSPGGKVPLQIQGIETDSVCGVGRLKHQESRYGIQRVLESSFKKSRAVGPGEDPSVAQPGIPHPGIRGAARDGVAAAGPKLYLVSPILDPGLGPGQRSAEQQTVCRTISS